jgi:hypothetical protein
VETIPAIEEEVFKIQPFEIEPQIELVEEEVRIIKTKIQVKTTKLKMGIEPLVVIQVVTTKIIIKETYV